MSFLLEVEGASDYTDNLDQVGGEWATGDTQQQPGSGLMPYRSQGAWGRLVAFGMALEDKVDRCG